MTKQSHALALSNEELMSVAHHEDTLSHKEHEHLAQCSICQQKLTTYTRTNTQLLTKLYRSVCPSAVELNYYCLGMIPAAQIMSIASHILDCPSCADDVTLIRRQQAAFDPFPPATFSLQTAIRRLVATLVVQQAQPVLREHTHDSGWPRQYRAESIELSLHLSRNGNNDIMLLGIITDSDDAKAVNAFEGMVVQLFHAPDPHETTHPTDAPPFLTTQIEDVGNILLEPIPAGRYMMVIHLPGREVIIEDVNIPQK
jgi:hypothetical protein